MVGMLLAFSPRAVVGQPYPYSVLQYPQLDTGRHTVAFVLDAEGVFYNAEFSHPMKTGYTLPGVRVAPRVRIVPGERVSLELGYCGAYMFGDRGLMVSRPVATLAVHPVRGLSIAIGTLPDSRAHRLPEYIYTRQRAWIAPAEMGVRIGYAGRYFRGETWVDWEEFIWRNADRQEAFLYGLMGEVCPLINRDIRARLFVLARHQGGQIDTIDAPVVTSSQIGGELVYRSIPLGSQGWIVTVATSGAFSHDGAKNLPTGQANGFALHPYIGLGTRGAEVVLGYYMGYNFHTLRGEEYFASYSLWSEGRSELRRSVLTARGSYAYRFGEVASLLFTTDVYYDMRQRRTDWAAFLTLRTGIGIPIL